MTTLNLFKGAQFIGAAVAAIGLLTISSDTVSAEMPKPERQFMSLGTSSVGGTLFPLGGAMASIISNQYPELNITAEVTGGTSDNLRLIENDQLELGFATAADAYMAVNGKEPFREKIDSFGGVIAGNGVFWQLYTLKQNNIASIRDLEGKRISLGAAGSVANSIGETVLEAHGLEMGKDWRPDYLGHGDGPGALRDGTVDAVLIVSAFPTSAVIDLTSSEGEDVVFLNPEPEVLEELLEEHPYWIRTPIPGGVYNGHPDDIPNSFGISMILVASKDLSDEAVYAVTKSILENNELLSSSHSLGKDWSKENATGALKGLFEFHPGAEAYLKEQGLL